MPFPDFVLYIFFAGVLVSLSLRTLALLLVLYFFCLVFSTFHYFHPGKAGITCFYVFMFSCFFEIFVKNFFLYFACAFCFCFCFYFFYKFIFCKFIFLCFHFCVLSFQDLYFYILCFQVLSFYILSFQDLPFYIFRFLLLCLTFTFSLYNK